MNKIIKCIGLLGCLFLLIGKAGAAVSQANIDLKREYSLQNTMFLCESMSVSDKATNKPAIYLLSPGQFLEFSGLPLPTLSQYQQNQAYWQQWKTTQQGSKDRVIGLVDKGTVFLLKQYQTTPTEDYAVVKIGLKNGPFAGRDVLFSEHEFSQIMSS